MTLQAGVILALVVIMVFLGVKRHWRPFLNCMIGLGIWLIIAGFAAVPLSITAGSLAPAITVIGIGAGLIVGGIVFKRRLSQARF